MLQAGTRASAWIPALPLSAALLGAGCASAKGHYAQPPLLVSVEQTQHAGDRDVELWIARLPPETILRVLGSHGERLARSATILEVRISAGASPVPVSRDSLRLRLPSGEEEPPLETRWVLAAMSRPGIGADGGSSGSGNWPAEGAIDIKIVFWPKTGGIPKEGRVPLELRFELERCTWQGELEIPMN